MARGLFVEPFFGGSHGAFAEGLQRHSRHDFELLTLPGGEWRRRMRRGAQELAPFAARLKGEFDFLIATDMLDLPAFLALTRPRFGNLPVMLYMHENQFTYPRLRGTKFNSWFGQVNYLSACVADAVAFNSEFHRQDFLGALRALAEQPNNWLIPEAIHEIERKSLVLPVGVELAWLDGVRVESQPENAPLVLWNHRWEFDKAPETFASVIGKLAAEGVPFRLAIAGEPGDNPSLALVELAAQHADRVEHLGFVEQRDAYGRLLWESDVVVSTTRHEFFGVGMVEALYAGCLPIAPNRYNYPALVPEAFHHDCLYDGVHQLEEKLRAALTRPARDRAPFHKSAARFGWPVVAKQWDSALDELACGGFATKLAQEANGG